MIENILQGPVKPWRDIILSGAIFVMVFCSGFFPVEQQRDVLVVLYAILYFTTVLALDKHRQNMFYAALLIFIISIIVRFTREPILRGLSQVLNFVFFSLIVTFFIIQISRALTVTKNVILQAINGYMLLGIVFTSLIGLMVQADPSSFNFTDNAQVNPNDYLYYAFVTFATLGYGDFLPIKPYAKSLAILISVSGQFYLAVIVALLVGKFTSQTISHAEKS